MFQNISIKSNFQNYSDNCAFFSKNISNDEDFYTSRLQSSVYHDVDIDINKEIEDFAQGTGADCWLISGLKSLSFTEKGRQIISDSIKINDDGSYTVSFAGLENSQYTISEKELQRATKNEKYTTGDDDVLLMEIAFEKALKDVKNGKYEVPDYVLSQVKYKSDVLYGGQLHTFIYLMTGENSDIAYNCYHADLQDDEEYQEQKAQDIQYGDLYNTELEEIYDKIEEAPQDYVAVLSVKNGENALGEISVTDVDGNEIVLADGSHAISIKSVEDDVLTLVNPWDTSSEIKVEKDEINEYVKRVAYYKFD